MYLLVMALELIRVQYFHYLMVAWKKNIIVCRADMSLSSYINKKRTNILVLGKAPTQGLDDITLIAEAKYGINCTQLWKRFVLSLHYNGSNSLSFVNATKFHQFKSRDSEIKDYTLYLGNI